MGKKNSLTENTLPEYVPVYFLLVTFCVVLPLIYLRKNMPLTKEERINPDHRENEFRIPEWIRAKEKGLEKTKKRWRESKVKISAALSYYDIYVPWRVICIINT
jgi:hypothetical protein